MNQTELNWLGYRREEVVNKLNILDLLSEKSAILFYKYMPVLRGKGHVDQVEVEYVRKDGSVIHALVSSRAMFDETKQFKCVTSTVWDISDRKKMEDEMLKVNRHMRAIKERFEEKSNVVQKLNEELQALKKERNEFYHTAGPDLILPLEEVSALCTSALGTSATAADMRHSLKQIQKTANHLSELLNNMVLHQRMASENAPLQLSKFNLSGLLITVVNRLEEVAARKPLNINCEIFEAIWIRSDKEVLGQIVDTLLSTVIKLALPGMEIPLRLIHKKNEYLIELEVRGLSIGRKELADLFDKNKQVMSETGKNSAIVLDSHLVNTLVGNLGFELSVGPLNHRGTLIRLVIPAAKVG
jgi:PAS domain S-box-containing protein